jgi:membrane protease YdiL (CAAX protease family)
MELGSTALTPHFLLAIAFLAIAVRFPFQIQSNRLPKLLIIAMTLVSLVTALSQSLFPATGLLLIAAFSAAIVLIQSPYLTVSNTAKVTLGILALILSLHVFGWQRIILDPEFNLGSTNFQWYANYDKPLAGLFIAIAFYVLQEPPRPQPRLSRPGLLVVTLGIVALVAMTKLLGATFNPKWSASAFMFLLTNLFFTVIPEELFFRKLLQSALPAGNTKHSTFTVGIMTVLFTAAHYSASANVAYLVLVAIAALIYAFAFQLTRSVVFLILVHFTVNALSVSLFNYPVQVSL